MEDLRKQANDLLVFYAKMQGRLSQAGVNDTGSLVTLFSQLHKGLEAISVEELDPAIQEVTRLVDSLRKMQADLQVLKELKTRMGEMISAAQGSAPGGGAQSSGGGGRRAA